LRGLLSAFLEQLELVLLVDDEPVDGVVLRAELAEGVRNFFLFLVAGLPGGDEVVRLQQGVELCVTLGLLETVLPHHYASVHIVALRSLPVFLGVRAERVMIPAVRNELGDDPA